MPEPICNRIRKEGAKEKAVVYKNSCEALPIAKDESPPARKALMCILGQYMDATEAMGYIVMPMIWLRRGDTLSEKEWFSYAIDTASGVCDELREQFIETREAWDGDEINHIIRLLNVWEENVSVIGRTVDRVMQHNLYDVNWSTLVSAGMQPYAASQFCQLRGETEEVMLTKRMLRWLYLSKYCLTERQQDNVPVETPEKIHVYREWAYLARRAQRVVFPGMTAQQCQLLIDLPSAAYTKGMVDV